jgi:GNAT superfamily N-acetyltransferase
MPSRSFPAALSLDHWLQQRAMKNQASGASRTFVACKGRQVIAYYALAAGAIATTTAPGPFRRNMPDSIPVVLLGRPAIEQVAQRQQVGRAMVRDAAERILRVAEEIGIRGVITHAISPSAKLFYEQIGFDPSPSDPMMLMIAMSDLRGAIP